MTSGGTNLGTAYGYIEIQDNVDAAVQTAQGAFDRAVKGMSSQMQAFGDTVSQIGVQITLLTAPLMIFMKSGIDKAIDFEESMTNAGAVLGLTKEEIDALSDTILEFGRDTRAGPQAVADAYYDIVGGVVDATTHMAILEAATATAEAGNTELAGATKALISIMNSYGYSAEEAAMVSDVLTRTVGAGVGTMEEFAAALPQVTGLAAANGVELDNVAASMAWLTTQGFTASESATKLTAIMTAMLNPNEKMKAAMKELGWESGAAALEMYGLAGVTGRLANAFGEDALGPMLGSVEALQGAIALNKRGFEEFIGNFIDTREGATAAARAIQNLSRAARLDRMKSQFEALSISVGDALLPVLEELMNTITPIIEGITDWIKENPELAQQVLLLAGAVGVLGPVLAIAGTAISAIGALIGALLSPIGLVIAAVAALGVAYVNNFGGIRDFIDGSVMPALMDFFNWLGGVWTNTIAPGLQKLYDWFVTDALPGVVGFVENTVKPAIDELIGILESMWAMVSPALDQIYTWFVVSGLPAIQRLISDTVVPAIQSWIGNMLSIWHQVEPGLRKLWDWFTVTGLPAIQTFITETAIPAIAWLISTISNIWNIVAPALGAVAAWFLETGIPAIINVVGLVVLAVGGFIDLLRGIWTAVQPGLSELWTRMQAGMDWVRTNVIQPVIDLINSIPDAVNKAIAAITGLGGVEINPSQYGSSEKGGMNVPDFGGGTAGFARGGYTGDGPANQVAGVVHGQEWVVPKRGALVLRGGDDRRERAGVTFAPGSVQVYANTREGGVAAAESFMDELEAIMRERGAI